MADLAVLDEQDPARAAGRTDGMRDHQDGLAAGTDIGEDAQQLVRGAGIERAGRLVGQQQTGVRDDRAGNGRALLLAAGDLIRIFFQQLRDAELRRDGLEPCAKLALRHAREHERQIDVVLDREGVEQVELLKDEAEIVAAEGGAVGLADGREVFAVEQHLAGGRLVEPGEDIQERGLAGAGFAHDGDVFAVFHAEIDVFERLDRRAAKARRVDLAQAVHFENLHKKNASCESFCAKYIAPGLPPPSIPLTLSGCRLTVL